MNSMILKRIQTILALLLVGSVSMLAEGDDPFPEVNPYDFYGNMIMTAKVVLNGEMLNDAIVAVYCDDEIRGKEKRPDEDNFFLLTVYGHSGKEQYLHFKVYTNGRIIEVDQGLKYAFNATYGSYAHPYIINLTTVTTNTSAEGWATTCLPFNAAVPEGVSVYTASRIEDGVLKIEPVACTILPKDTPVLLKTESKTSYEWLSRVAEGNAEIETNLFKGTTEALSVEAGSVLTLGHATDGNKAIGFWRFNGTTVPANRAYLEPSVAAEVRGVTIDWDGMAAGIGEVKSERVKSEKCADTWYDLSGRKIRHASSIISHPSFVILNGKKIFMR